MTTGAGIFIVFWLFASAAAVGALVAHLLRTSHTRTPRGERRPDSEPHRRRLETEARIEEHDIGDLLDAIAEHRRRRGCRDIGDELADELLRGTSDDAE